MQAKHLSAYVQAPLTKARDAPRVALPPPLCCTAFEKTERAIGDVAGPQPRMSHSPWAMPAVTARAVDEQPGEGEFLCPSTPNQGSRRPLDALLPPLRPATFGKTEREMGCT